MAMSRSWGDTPFTTLPPIRMRPRVGLSSPATQRSAVVFPHPDGPTRIMNSPSAIWSERSSRATAPPGKVLVRFWKTTSAIPLSLQPGGGDPPDEVPLRHEEQRQHGHHAH